MRTLLQSVFLIVVIFTLAVAVDQIAPLKQLTLYLNQHPDPYREISLGMSLTGWVLLIGAFVLGFSTKGRPMSADAARRYMQSGAGRPSVSRRFWGRVAGREFHMAVTFPEVKEAFRTGAWWRDSHWWPICIGLVATPLVGIGMLGYFFVVGPPLVKLMCAAAGGYASAPSTWNGWTLLAGAKLTSGWDARTQCAARSAVAKQTTECWARVSITTRLTGY